MNRPECDGTGEIAVTYADMQGFPYDIEHAMQKAGKVHHMEECQHCHGTGIEPRCDNCALQAECGEPGKVCDDWEAEEDEYYKPTKEIM